MSKIVLSHSGACSFNIPFQPVTFVPLPSESSGIPMECTTKVVGTKFYVRSVRQFFGVLPRPLSLDRSRQRIGRVDGEECVVGWGGGGSLVAQGGFFQMGAEIPSSSELIVACMGGFSPRGVASSQFRQRSGTHM